MPGMPWLRALGRNLFRHRQAERELSAEVTSYVELLAAEKVAAGMEPEQARRAALVELGGREQVKEAVRQVRRGAWLEPLGRDVRFSLRGLRKTPGFTLVAVLTLALGIGANSAIFQLLDAVRLRVLPVRAPEELARVRISNATPGARSGSFGGRFSDLTYALWQRIQNEQRAFSGMTAWGYASFDLAPSGESRFSERALWVNGDFFRVLGVRPVLGRLFTAADDQPACGAPGVVISYTFWQSEFGGAPAAVGRKLTLNGRPFEVIGVTPANFHGVELGRSYDLALPLCAGDVLHGERSRLRPGAANWNWWLASLGRLKPGWTLEQANAHLQSISPGIFRETLHGGWSEQTARTYLSFQLAAYPGASGVSRLGEQYSQSLWLLLGIAGLVLLIACANLANLLLARASAREREVAVRLALGASRGRLARQFVVESLLLAGMGGAAALWLSPALGGFIVSLISTDLDSFFVPLAENWRVLGFTAAVATVTCLLFGLAPAWRATRVDPGEVMKGARGFTGSVAGLGLRRALVVSQVALSLVLLVGGLLFSRSLFNVLTVDAGFRQDGILEADVDLSRLKRTVQGNREDRRNLLARLRAIPGVQLAATTTHVPTVGNWGQYFFIIGQGEPQKTYANGSIVSAGYFATLDIPFLAGRDFDEGDALGGQRVAIVSESFARRVLPGASPIGKELRWEADGGALGPPVTIVGLVRDTKYESLRSDFAPLVYFASSQDERMRAFENFLLRSDLPPAALMTAVRQSLAGFHPGLSFHFHHFKEQLRGALMQEKLMAVLSGFFGGLAALLAAIGLYGVMAYAVACRTNEIGIRMALGANAAQVVRMILREAWALVVVGLGIGAVLAVPATRAAGTMLYGLEPHDPATLFAALTVLAAVALAAGYLPAQRAARVDPLVALRHD